MDKCTDWEVNDLIDNIPYLDRNMWEGNRLNAYITAQANCRKRISFQDICTFKWEEKEEQKVETRDQEISNTDIERLKKLSQEWQGKQFGTHEI